MSTHTPGPWTQDKEWRRSDIANRVTTITSDATADVVALIIGGGPETEAEDEANARLIAAAPDLLAVCKAVLACELRHDENGHAYLHVPARSLNDLGAQIRAAISRATNAQGKDDRSKQ